MLSTYENAPLREARNELEDAVRELERTDGLDQAQRLDLGCVPASSFSASL